MKFWFRLIGGLFQDGFVFDLVNIARWWPLVTTLLVKGTIRSGLSVLSLKAGTQRSYKRVVEVRNIVKLFDSIAVYVHIV